MRHAHMIGRISAAASSRGAPPGTWPLPAPAHASSSQPPWLPRPVPDGQPGTPARRPSGPTSGPPSTAAAGCPATRPERGIHVSADRTSHVRRVPGTGARLLSRPYRRARSGRRPTPPHIGRHPCPSAYAVSVPACPPPSPPPRSARSSHPRRRRTRVRTPQEGTRATATVSSRDSNGSSRRTTARPGPSPCSPSAAGPRCTPPASGTPERDGHRARTTTCASPASPRRTAGPSHCGSSTRSFSPSTTPSAIGCPTSPPTGTR